MPTEIPMPVPEDQRQADRIYNDDGYDVTNMLVPGALGACSLCGEETFGPFCDDQNGCAPVCRSCYDQQRDNETCGACGAMRPLR